MVSNVGGQAVIEGVMMKHNDNIAVAVRDPSGKIIVKKEKLKFKENKIFFIRGIVNLFLMMYVGIRALNFSAEVATGQVAKKGNINLILSLIVSVVVGIFLFKFLPLGAAELVDNNFQVNSLTFNIVDGLVRFGILLLYIIVIAQMSDIKRVFQYHGAEHKVVNCYESGKELTVKNVQSFTTVHKRCGTTFVFLVVLISILVYIFIPKELAFAEKLGLRLLFLPLIASVSYEVLRAGAKYNFLKPLIYPGLLVQKLTTREPDDKQVEVAIKSLNSVLEVKQA